MSEQGASGVGREAEKPVEEAPFARTAESERATTLEESRKGKQKAKASKQLYLRDSRTFTIEERG